MMRRREPSPSVVPARPARPLERWRRMRALYEQARCDLERGDDARAVACLRDAGHALPPGSEEVAAPAPPAAQVARGEIAAVLEELGRVRERVAQRRAELLAAREALRERRRLTRRFAPGRPAGGWIDRSR